MKKNNTAAVLFSGGTDSFCTAALCCEQYEEVHLLTFYEQATQSSPVPQTNIQKLRHRYPHIRLTHSVISTDAIVKQLSYENYFKRLREFGLLNLATPGLSSLSWHIAAILYCHKQGISFVHDGMTKELLHLPGHMPEIRSYFQKLYANFEIHFSSLVIDWDVPEDQRFMDKLIVDRHGFALKPKQAPRSTGQWLYEHGLLPHPNVKGSAFDRLMQHDCYPFIVYNMVVFWIYDAFWGYDFFKKKLSIFMDFKTQLARQWLRGYMSQPDRYSFLHLSETTIAE